MTWAGVYGIAFPILIMALVPLRQYVIPKLFPASSLRYLDTAEDVEEEIEADREDAETAGSPHPEFGAFVQQKHVIPEGGGGGGGGLFGKRNNKA